MKKITAVLCTFALLFSLSACSVGRPDLEIESKEQSADAGKDIKKFEIKDNRVRMDLSDKFRIDASITTGDGSSLSCYEQKTINLTEDQIADMILGSGAKREDKADGVVGYTKDRENLDVQLVDTSAMALMNSPSLFYSLDKGKEYKAVSNYIFGDGSSEDEGAKNAAELVEGKLDKLPIEYSELQVYKAGHEQLNSIYANELEMQKEVVKEAESDSGENSYDSMLYNMGKYELLDENFEFTAEDDCYIVRGSLMIKGLPLMISEFYNYDITAAVSSRGIEYLNLTDLYSAENPYSDASVISPEEAVNTFYKAYEASTVKDRYEVIVTDICLSYLKQGSFDESTRASKDFFVPVWSIQYKMKDADGNELGSAYCHVSAADGTLQTPESFLFSLTFEGVFWRDTSDTE